jgi:hypothetical protein
MRELPRDSELFKRYLKTLEAQETEMDDLQAKLKALHADEAKAKADYDDLVTGLELNAATPQQNVGERDGDELVQPPGVPRGEPAPLQGGQDALLVGVRVGQEDIDRGLHGRVSRRGGLPRRPWFAGRAVGGILRQAREVHRQSPTTLSAAERTHASRGVVT